MLKKTSTRGKYFLKTVFCIFKHYYMPSHYYFDTQSSKKITTFKSLLTTRKRTERVRVWFCGMGPYFFSTIKSAFLKNLKEKNTENGKRKKIKHLNF